MRAVVTPERALAIQQLAASFKTGAPRPLKAFQKMLGLMASASSVLQFRGLLPDPSPTGPEIISGFGSGSG